MALKSGVFVVFIIVLLMIISLHFRLHNSYSCSIGRQTVMEIIVRYKEN